MTTEPQEPKPKKRHREASGTVAIILAIGMAVALNVITVALLWAAVIRLGIDINAGLSDNGVQVLLAWGGGIISVLAGYVGYIVGKKEKINGSEVSPDDHPDPQ